MTKKQLREKLTKMAEKLEWDDLSYDIIVMEKALRIKQNANSLNLLLIKLDIWEKEKSNRIFSKFNIKTILYRGLDDSDIEFS